MDGIATRSTGRRALVTGISGFVGRHLAECLISSGWDVHGFDRVCPPQSPAGVAMHPGDLLDERGLAQTLASVQPSHVFHLAALIVDEPLRPYEVNVTGTARLFEALHTARSTARVIVTSSSAVYGQADSMPIDENAPLRPCTHYAASKAGQEMIVLAQQLAGADVVRIRPFNLIGPGQSAGLVTSAIARQIARAERSGGGTIRVGRTSATRDYTDVRDAVRAYVSIAENPDLRDVFNVCTGRAVSVKDCLDRLVALASVRVDVEFDAGRLRSNDVHEQIGSPARVKAATGWEARIPFEESLQALLDDCRRLTTETENDV